MWTRLRNADRLQRIAFVKAGGETRFTGCPCAGFVGKLDDIRHRRWAFAEFQLRSSCRFGTRGRSSARKKHGGGEGRIRCRERRTRRNQSSDLIEEFGRIGG